MKVVVNESVVSHSSWTGSDVSCLHPLGLFVKLLSTHEWMNGGLQQKPKSVAGISL